MSIVNDEDRIFKECVSLPLMHYRENTELGLGFAKFQEKATGKVFIIFVREELPGKKIIVTERSKEKRVKVKSRGWFKPI